MTFKSGQTAIFTVKGLDFMVKILEIKNSYGRTRYRVTPVKGKGEAVVELLSINKSEKL